MRSRMKIGLVLAVVTFGVFHLTQLVSWAQESADNVNFDETANEIAVAGKIAEIEAKTAAIRGQQAQSLVRRKFKQKGGDPYGERFLFVHKDLGDEVHEAAAVVNEAEGDEAKEAAQANLNALLVQYFDDDMKRREEELVKIEERLVKLKSLLDLRREKKQEIIDLQSKVALNEAAGLGFYGNDSPGEMSKGFHFEGGPRSETDVFIHELAPVRVGLPLPPAPPTATILGAPYGGNAPVAVPPSTFEAPVSR